MSSSIGYLIDTTDPVSADYSKDILTCPTGKIARIHITNGNIGLGASIQQIRNNTIIAMTQSQCKISSDGTLGGTLFSYGNITGPAYIRKFPIGFSAGNTSFGANCVAHGVYFTLFPNDILRGNIEYDASNPSANFYDIDAIVYYEDITA